MSRFSTIVRRDISQFFRLKESDRPWHIALIAAISTGLSLASGYYMGRMEYGTLACMGCLVILYLPNTPLAHRMMTMLACSFGFIFSYAIGLTFSFHPYLSALAIGTFSFGINWTTNYYRLPPPRNFFFIMLASIASCAPFDVTEIPLRTGLIACGTIIACMVAFAYSLIMIPVQDLKPAAAPAAKKVYANFSESAIIGLFIFLSLCVAHLFHFTNPYWIPISCLAIMQGLNVALVRQRSFHRITGTTVGMGLSWLLLQFRPDVGGICLIILALQFTGEFFVKRHYALAMVFYTPMTLFLAELGNRTEMNADTLVKARLIDIVIGSLIGVIGGLVLHNRKLHRAAEIRMRRSRMTSRRKQ